MKKDNGGRSGSGIWGAGESRSTNAEEQIQVDDLKEEIRNVGINIRSEKGFIRIQEQFSGKERLCFWNFHCQNQAGIPT